MGRLPPPLLQALLGLLRTRPSDTLRLLDSRGWLDILLPEIAAMRGIPQPPQFHAEGDVLVHTRLALQALARHYPEASDVLVLAVLLHDVGKPPTLAMPATEGDRIRFDAHDRMGSTMARDIVYRLGFSASVADDVEWLVAHHMAFFAALPSMRAARAARTFADPRFVDLVRLHHCDCLSSIRPDGEGDFSSLIGTMSRYAEYWSNCISDEHAETIRRRLRDSGLDGHGLRRRFGRSPGPWLGRCQRALVSALEENPGLDDAALLAIAEGAADAPDGE